MRADQERDTPSDFASTCADGCGDRSTWATATRFHRLGLQSAGPRLRRVAVVGPYYYRRPHGRQIREHFNEVARVKCPYHFNIRRNGLRHHAADAEAERARLQKFRTKLRRQPGDGAEVSNRCRETSRSSPASSHAGARFGGLGWTIGIQGRVPTGVRSQRSKQKNRQLAGIR